MRRIVDFFYPRRCLLCDGTARLLPGLHICQACEAELRENHSYCSQCAVPLDGANAIEQPVCGQCLAKAPPFSRSWSPFVYAQPMEWMIQQLKFNAKLAFAPLLAELMIRRLPAAMYKDDRPDVIIPMPLHKTRIRQRGFNQSTLLAQPLAQRLSVKLDPDCCERIRDTEQQTGKNARQRQQNIRGAFKYHPQQHYRHVVIFDDVVTTASTVSELSKTLLAGGVERIEVLSLSRAEK